MSFQIYFTDELHGRERIRVCVSDSEEEFRNTTVEELKRKLIPGDQLADTILHYCFYTLEENRTLGFYGVQHEGHIIAERRIRKPQSSSFYRPPAGLKHEDEFTSGRKQCRCPTGSPEDDEDDDKVIPRSRSMDNLCDMNQPQLEPNE